MEKIDLNNVLFHGLTQYLVEDKEEKQQITLDLILKSAAILSRNKQLEYFSREILPRHYIDFPRNGYNWVSVCTKQSMVDNRENSECFTNFIEGSVSIVLDPILLNEIANRNDMCNDGEIQVKDMIPSKYFLGILVNEMSDEKHIKRIKKVGNSAINFMENCMNRISVFKNIISSNEYDLPIYSNIDGKIITNKENILKHLKLEEINNKQNQENLEEQPEV